MLFQIEIKYEIMTFVSVFAGVLAFSCNFLPPLFSQNRCMIGVGYQLLLIS